MRIKSAAVVALALIAPAQVIAQQGEQESWNAHFQTTYIWQRKDSFAAAYSGPNSLGSAREKSYSFSATAAIGLRPWPGGELYFNPEVIQGVPLSNLAGLGSITNGEVARSSSANPTLYRARLFLRQTWGFGGERETVASEMNQLAGEVSARRLVLTVGKLSVLDLFDDNLYSHDARTQFMNWSMANHGAYEHPSDTRGYSWGAALEHFHDEWAIRLGRFLLPKRPGGQALDSRILRQYGDQLEVEREHEIGGKAGKLRLLLFRSVANMGGYRDALDFAAANGDLPDVSQVRSRRAKHGIGIGIEQAISANVGAFARLSRNSGDAETYTFPEIDRSISVGVTMSGASWRRRQDMLGIAIARNGISAAHRDYLAAGGLGPFIGDGALTYRPEQAIEVFYSLNVRKGAWLSADLQHISNPGYNADRGPANVVSLRLHAEF